jgi:hypothetical protein
MASDTEMGHQAASGSKRAFSVVDDDILDQPPKSPDTSESDDVQTSPVIKMPAKKRSKTSTPVSPTPTETIPPNGGWPHKTDGQDWSLVTRDGPKLVTEQVLGRKPTKKIVKEMNNDHLTDYSDRKRYCIARHMFKCKDFKIPNKPPTITTNQILPSKFNLVAGEKILKHSYIMELNYRLTDRSKTKTKSIQISKDPLLLVEFQDEPTKKGSHLGSFIRDEKCSRGTKNVDLVVLMTEKYPRVIVLASKDIQVFEPLTTDFDIYRTV